LATISRETKISLKDYGYYTKVKNGDQEIALKSPDPYITDFKDNQLIMVLAMALEEPVKMEASGFKVSVSDPTYYVAVELPDNQSVIVSGEGAACQYDIVRPDFDALWAKDERRMAELFDAGPDEKVEASDDYLTWVEFKCAS
jgi:ABC-type uncharacterized transport system substrate-binding protein